MSKNQHANKADVKPAIQKHIDKQQSDMATARDAHQQSEVVAPTSDIPGGGDGTDCGSLT